MNSNLLMNKKVNALIREGQDLLTPAHLTDEQVNRLTEILKALVFQYAKLIALPQLNDTQADQLEKILELAEDNEILSNWLTELDHASGHAMGYLNPDSRKLYKDIYVLLKERCCHSSQQECEDYRDNCKFIEAKNGSAIRKKVDPDNTAPQPDHDPIVC